MADYNRDGIIETLIKRVDLLEELLAHHQAKSELHRALADFRNDVHGPYHGHGGVGDRADHSKLLPLEAAYEAAQEYLNRKIEKLETMMARADEEHRLACERCKEDIRLRREREWASMSAEPPSDENTPDDCTSDACTPDSSTTASMTEREDSPDSDSPQGQDNVSAWEERDARVQRWVREHDEDYLRPKLPSDIWMWYWS